MDLRILRDNWKPHLVISKKVKAKVAEHSFAGSKW